MPDQTNERKEPNMAKRRSRHAESYALNDQHQDEIGRLQRSLRTSTNKADVYKELAQLHYSRRQMDDAIDLARKSISLKRNDVQARELLLEMLIEINQFDDAITEAKELLVVSPRSLCARDVLGIAYLQKGMLEKALQITNELIALDPTSPTNHFKKAVLYQQKGDVGNAIHEFSRVLEMQPDGEMASQAQQVIDTLDSYQLRHIVMLAVEDYIFRTKLIHDPETAALERGYYLSYAGMSALKQIQFDELPEVYAEWKQRYYH